MCFCQCELGFLQFFVKNSEFFSIGDSLHARLNSQYETWGYKKMMYKKIKAYRKSAKKEPTVKKVSVNSRLKAI